MERKRIKYPLGIQTFSEIIEEDYLYVDKTALVYQLSNEYKYVFLSRPRRFGKSLLISTLEEYFKGNRGLFKGLAMENLEKKWISYPVLRFDLSAANYTEVGVLRDKLDAYLRRIEEELGIDAVAQLGDRFMNVIKAAHRQSGRRVVVLIDEYDKPMLESLHDDKLHEEMRAELRGFYSVLKECDAMIKFAMLTGVTKFGKVNIFSGLNNLKDISMLEDFGAICGITQEEFHEYFAESVEAFSEKRGIPAENVSRDFKRYYDGYHFTWPSPDVYNPYSTLNAFHDKKLKKYWFETGSSDYLIKLIHRHPFVLGRLEGAKRREDELNDITDISRDIVPLLYQAGYLTIKDYDEVADTYALGFPNHEVGEGFWNSFSSYFFRPANSMYNFSLEDFMHDIMHGEAEAFMERLKSLFSAVCSEHEVNKELHFQNMMAIFVHMLGFRVTTEMHSAQGRCDVVIESPQYVYIIELKVDGTPHEAMQQIHDRGYAQPFAMDNRTKILIGANFSTTTRTLTGWEIEWK